MKKSFTKVELSVASPGREGRKKEEMREGAKKKDERTKEREREREKGREAGIDHIGEDLKCIASPGDSQKAFKPSVY